MIQPIYIYFFLKCANVSSSCNDMHFMAFKEKNKLKPITNTHQIFSCIYRSVIDISRATVKKVAALWAHIQEVSLEKSSGYEASRKQLRSFLEPLRGWKGVESGNPTRNKNHINNSNNIHFTGDRETLDVDLNRRDKKKNELWPL